MRSPKTFLAVLAALEQMTEPLSWLAKLLDVARLLLEIALVPLHAVPPTLHLRTPLSEKLLLLLEKEDELCHFIMEFENSAHSTQL